MKTIKFPHPKDQPVRAGVVGQSGIGKSMLLERAMENFQEMKNVKVVDIFSSKIEGSFSTISGGSSYDEWQGENSLDPRKYSGQVYKPVTSELSHTQPDVVKPFTIPIKNLSEKSLQGLLGEVSTSQQALFSSMIREIEDMDDPNIADLISQAENLPDKDYVESESGMLIDAPSRRGGKQIQHKLVQLADNYTVTSEDSDLALELFSELDNTDRRMILETAQVKSDQLTLFIVVHMLQRILEMLKNGEIDNYIALFIREGHKLLKTGSEGTNKAFRSIVEEFLKESRQMGVSVFIDTQNPQELSGIARSQFNYLFVGRLNSAKGIDKILDERTKENFSREDKERVKGLDNQFFYVWTPEGLVKNFRSAPTRSRHREPGENFQTEYLKAGGKVKNWSSELKQVKEEIEGSVEQHNKRIKEKKKAQEQDEQEEDKFETIPGELLKEGRFKRKKVEELMDIGESQARNYLRRWREKGFIEKIKEGRQVFYEIP